MQFSKLVLIYFLAIIQTVSAFAQTPMGDQADLETHALKAPSLVMDFKTSQDHTQLSYTEIPLDNPSQLGEFLLKEETRNTDILLSTDSPEIYQSVANAVVKTEENSSRIFRFIPIGKLASAKEKMASGWANYKKNAKHTIQYDKIGLSVVVITTSVDSFVWVHAAGLDVYQKSAMIMMNVVFAAAFGLDRDLFSKMTTPVRHRIISGLDKLAHKISGGRVESEDMYTQKVIASRYLASLTVSLGFQVLRASIMSFHELSTAVMTTGFWLNSLKISAIVTAAGFAWGELMASADVEKNPVAKNSLKRFSDVRSVVLSQLASMGMIMQPNVYGYTPIVAIVTSGSLGLLALIKSNNVISWLEKNKATNILFKKQRTLENIMNDAVLNVRDGAEDLRRVRLMPSIGRKNACTALFN